MTRQGPPKLTLVGQEVEGGRTDQNLRRRRVASRPPARSGASCLPTPIAPRDLKEPLGLWNAATRAVFPERPASSREGEREGEARLFGREGDGAQKGPLLFFPPLGKPRAAKEGEVWSGPGNL